MRLLLIAALTLLAFQSTSWAQDRSAAGVWRTIDDESGKPRSLVRIRETEGEFQGKIERLFRDPGDDPDPKCEKCEGASKGQRVIGMTILHGMKKDGSEYRDGQILDPANGKVYKSRMYLSEDGKTLEVRGYIGVPLLGRSQTWVRVE